MPAKIPLKKSKKTSKRLKVAPRRVKKPLKRFKIPSKKQSGITLREPKKTSRQTLLIIVLAGSILFFSLLLYFFPKNSTQDNPTLLVPDALALTKQEQALLPAEVQAELPVRLKIPKINIDTTLEHVGLTPEGAAGVPKNPINAAWFNFGPRPGDTGSAIITGHYGPWKNNIPTVFNNLYKLRKGDKIYIKDKKGATITFVVRELRTYDEHADASDVFISGDGKAHLNLITCQGIWNKITKSYSERLVVFTDKE